MSTGRFQARARRLWAALSRPPSLSRGAAPLRRHAGIVAALAVAAVLATGVLLDAASLGDWSEPLQTFGRMLTNLGDSGVYLVPIGLALIVLALLPPRGGCRSEMRLDLIWGRLAFVFVDVAVSGLLTNVVKRLIGRVRPHHLDGDAVLMFNPGHWSSRYASFPSGHAETAFAVVTAVWLLFGPRLGLAAAAAGLAVMAARVFVGAHFPSDVVAGAVVGVVFTLAFAAWCARRRLVFRRTGDGGLAPRRLPRQTRRLSS